MEPIPDLDPTCLRRIVELTNKLLATDRKWHQRMAKLEDLYGPKEAAIQARSDQTLKDLGGAATAISGLITGLSLGYMVASDQIDQHDH